MFVSTAGGIIVDELERMAIDAKKFTRSNLEKKRNKILNEVQDYEFKTLLDAAELLFELRTKRHPTEKDCELIKIVEEVLKNEPFEYEDEDYILIAYKRKSG